ncbi:hypothetical protein [Neobacillus drentensis]|jgi:hypothetical protein
MIKKWTIAGFAYLLIVMAGYGIYSSIVQPDSIPHQNEEMNHK